MGVPRLLDDGPYAKLVRPALLVLMCLYPIWFAIHYRGVYDPDVWWHLRTGEWIVQHHAVPQTDSFSSFGQGRPWVVYSWLFDLAIAGLHRACGLFGVFILYPVALVLATEMAVCALARQLRLGPWNALLLTGGALVAMAPAFAPRPGLVSIAFFAVELYLLLRARLRGSSRPLWLLLGIFAVWANVHVQFIYGLFVLLLAASEPFLMRLAPGLWTGRRDNHREKTWWAVFGGCTMATLVNPYFARVYKVIFAYAAQRGQYQYVSELQPPSWHSYNNLVEFLVVAVAWVVLVRRRSLNPFPVLLLLVATVFGLRTLRDMWFAVLSATFVVATPADELRAQPARAAATVPGRFAIAAAVVAGAVLIGCAHPLSNAELLADVAEEFPVKAAQFVRENHLPGPLYNHWYWGGFLIWSLPEVPVAIDSRSNLHGDERMEQNLNVWAAASGRWRFDRDLLSARVIIANADDPLTSLLRADRGARFRVAYEDRRAVVFTASVAATHPAP